MKILFNHSDLIRHCETEFRMETKGVYVPHFNVDGNFSIAELDTVPIAVQPVVEIL